MCNRRLPYEMDSFDNDPVFGNDSNSHTDNDYDFSSWIDLGINKRCHKYGYGQTSIQNYFWNPEEKELIEWTRSIATYKVTNKHEALECISAFLNHEAESIMERFEIYRIEFIRLATPEMIREIKKYWDMYNGDIMLLKQGVPEELSSLRDCRKYEKAIKNLESILHGMKLFIQGNISA